VHEAEEIGGVVLPANQEPTLPLNPGEEALDNPATLVATQPPPVLRHSLCTIGLVWSDHLDALLAKLRVQRVAVVRTIADQTLRLRCIGLAYCDGGL
jgi:hypothetical protein